MCKLKKNNGEIENIVIIGKDENSMMHVFDFSTILSKIRIDIKKNENKMYDEEEVKKLLLKEIRWFICIKNINYYWLAYLL